MFFCRVGGVFLSVPDRNQHRRAAVGRSRSRSQVVLARRWWSLRECDIWFPMRGLSQMVPTARSERPETDEKGDRSKFGPMGANEADRRAINNDHPVLAATLPCYMQDGHLGTFECRECYPFLKLA